MISMDDCIGFSGLTADQVDLVARRMHMHPVIASEWIEAVLEHPGGLALVKCFLVDDRPFADHSAAGQFACECLRLLRKEAIN
ncbi:hypothetical protein [Rhodospirillum sp. A1_3_36]|uniref:hypothetical protein n=1 Tax=Rhodospirillum sp. A1_3_36 TaxID=3391666 RepID=UPI0039A55575